jgi:hypothetical protein
MRLLFAIDVLGFSLLSNHIHPLLRIRPDLATHWTDEEVARRWWRLHPPRGSTSSGGGHAFRSRGLHRRYGARRLAEPRSRQRCGGRLGRPCGGMPGGAGVEPRGLAAIARRLLGVARLDGAADPLRQTRCDTRRVAADSRASVDQRGGLARHGDLFRSLTFIARWVGCRAWRRVRAGRADRGFRAFATAVWRSADGEPCL